MPLPVVIDTDPGIDDCVALLLALASAELDVKAIVTIYGNTTLARTTRNAREIAARAGVSLPIHAGAEAPLSRPFVATSERHGESGLGYAAVSAASAVIARPNALLDVLAALPEQVTLVTLGPLTNLAHALAGDPGIVRARVAGHIAMGGNLCAPGTATCHNESNAWSDPEAFARVLDARLGTRWVGRNVTRELYLTGAEVEALGSSPDERWLRDALRFCVEFHRVHRGFDGCVLNDPIVVAELIESGLLDFEEVAVRVGTSGEERGCTLRATGGVPARFATAVRTDRVRRLLDARVFGGL